MKRDSDRRSVITRNLRNARLVNRQALSDKENLAEIHRSVVSSALDIENLKIDAITCRNETALLMARLDRIEAGLKEVIDIADE